MMNWKDTTTYGKYQKNREPNVWTYKNKYILVSVVKYHRHDPKNWVMHCRNLSIDTMSLLPNTATKEEAQDKALSIVRQRLELMLESVNQPEGANQER